MKQENLNNQLFEFATSLIDENRVLSIKMHGYSMYPTLKEGEVAYVEKCTANKLEIGEIVVFKSHNKLIAHRLVGIFYEKGVKMLETKGDKNTFHDAPFNPTDLVGKVTSIIRKGKILKSDSRSMKFQGFLAHNFSRILIPIYDFNLFINRKLSYISTKFNSIKTNVAEIAKHSGKLFFINAIISIFQGILPFALIYCIKLLVDLLTKTTAQNPQQQVYFIALLTVTAFVFLFTGLLSEIRALYAEKLSQSVTKRIYKKLHDKHETLDLSHFENPDKQDKIHRAVQEASFRPMKILNALLTGIKSVASALLLVGLFMSIRWYLVLILCIATIPGIFVRLKFAKKWYKLKDSHSTKEREMYYFNRILTGFPFAKELKLFGFSVFFRYLFTNKQEELFEETMSLRKSEIRLGMFAEMFAVMLIFISLGFISILKMNGEISIGTVVLFFFAFQRGYSVLNDLFRSITQILEDNVFLTDFIAFLHMPTQSKAVIDNPLAFSLKKDIRFENVNFRYESSKRNALKSVSLTIPSGKTVALVGANGSGKSTLIKLLCGFYQPDSGQILFDGMQANQIGEQTIRKNITAVFQDFALYNIAASANIGLGNIHEPINIEKARKAAKAAGIDEILANLPEGYNTLLGNLFKGGEELSIGQWQKIAIARAFYRDSELILMDEPSSALDADAEKQIIESLKKLAKGKTAVIISHRLSTVQWADLIYFIHEGEVLESGNHEELMALKGQYCSLFQTVNSL